MEIIFFLFGRMIGGDNHNGQLRASYRIVDHRERQIGPHSLSFNSSVNK